MSLLYNLLYPLREIFSGFNIFRYITFRAAMAALTAFIFSLIVGPIIIGQLKKMKIGEKINKGDSVTLDDIHKHKQNTPTMGGILILCAVLLSTLLWADIFNKYILLSVFVTLWLGATGLMDDYLKQVKHASKGLTAKAKFISQVTLGLLIGLILYTFVPENAKIQVPFLKDAVIDAGILYILFVVLVITGSSNAVNLTDGLDGLAIGCVIMAAIAFSILCYVTGNVRFSEYLLLPYVKGSGELTIFCASIFGAGLGFLWFNCYPAAVFMGDVGSLALGGALGAVAVFIRKEFLLALVGGVFVIEALSVIMQIASFKFRKKRIFKCAPLHHHFQFLGISENKVIIRFWIVASLLALLTLVTLKTR